MSIFYGHPNVVAGALEKYSIAMERMRKAVNHCQSFLYFIFPPSHMTYEWFAE